MHAVVMRDFGDPGVLRLEEVPTPAAGPGEVLVRVAAVEVSRTRDVATRTGQHPFSQQVTLPHVLGGHCAGTAVAVGDGVDESVVGERVAVMNNHFCGRCDACRDGREDHCPNLEMLGVHRWGSYAEYLAVPAAQLHVLPGDIGMAQAAALAATGPVGLTQLLAAGVQPGMFVLVPGATGALASTVAALVPTLGAMVVGLTRRPDAIVNAADMIVVNSTRPDFADAILAATGGARPRAAIDNVCAPEVFDRYFPALAHGSRIVVSGAIGPTPTLAVPARSLYSRSISLIGVRTDNAQVAARFWEQVRDGFRLPSGLVREYPLDAAARTHEAVAEGTVSGHTILQVSTTEGVTS